MLHRLHWISSVCSLTVRSRIHPCLNSTEPVNSVQIFFSIICSFFLCFFYYLSLSSSSASSSSSSSSSVHMHIILERGCGSTERNRKKKRQTERNTNIIQRERTIPPRSLMGAGKSPFTYRVLFPYSVTCNPTWGKTAVF